MQIVSPIDEFSLATTHGVCSGLATAIGDLAMQRGLASLIGDLAML